MVRWTLVAVALVAWCAPWARGQVITDPGGATALDQRDPNPRWLRGAHVQDLVGQRINLIALGRCTGLLCSDQRQLDMILSLSDLHPGLTISREVLERSHSNLMETGFFQRVDYVATSGPVGVDVRIDLSGKVFVDKVVVDVAEWFPAVFEREIRRRLVYRPGRALDPDPGVKARQEDTIRRLYERKGFEGTRVEISWTVRGHLATVTVRIHEGRGYRLRDVHVKGATFFTPEEVAQVFAGTLNLSGTTLWGATLIPALTRELREEREADLLRAYQEEGYFEASVRARVDKDPKHAVMDLWVDIDEGPRYEITYRGNEALRDWDLREKLTFWQSRSVTGDDIERSAKAMRQAYVEEGYYFARVTPEVDPEDFRKITFVVQEGPKARIATIHFKNNRAFGGDDQVLKAQLVSGESGLITSRRLVPEQLEGDLGTIIDYYRDHGYLRVEVEEPMVYLDPGRTLLYRAPGEPPPGHVGPGVRVVSEPPDVDGEVPLHVDIPVREGVQTMVGSLHVEGNHLLSTRETKALLGLEIGGPYSPARFERGLGELRRRYIESGFPNAIITPLCRSEAVGTDCTRQGVRGRRVDVSVLVREGTRARLGEVFVRGNRYTRTDVIREEIPMEPGDLFDRGKLMEGQARLRTLGLFRAIRITEIGSSPDAPRDRIALVIEVEEKEHRFLEFNVTTRSVGLGPETNVLLWGLETRFLEGNLLGRGLHLGVPLRVGNEKTSLEPALLWPRPFRLMLPTTFRLFASMENDLRSSVDVVPVSADPEEFFTRATFSDNYNRFRFGGEVKVVLERWSLRATPSLKLEREGERKRLQQRLCISGEGTRADCIDFDNLFKVALPVLFDRRDNPLHPTEGYSILVEGNYSRKLTLGEASEAETQYARLMTTLQGYVPLFSRRLVVAAMTRFSWVIPLLGPEEDIPTEDMFFFGGDGKVRGFAEKSVGPRDEAGLPAGDMVRLLGTLELRLHLVWWLWAAGFYDTGMLVHGPSEISLGEARHSVGLGLRLLLLELIPVRFDFARVLDQRPGEQYSIFTFNLGYPF